MACRMHLADGQPHKAWAAFKQGQDQSRILGVLNLPLANGSSSPGAAQPSAASQAAAGLQQLRLAILAGAVASNDRGTMGQVRNATCCPSCRCSSCCLHALQMLWAAHPHAFQQSLAVLYMV